MPMDNGERLELRRRRMAAAPPILRGGFRPFFLGAGLWAVAAIILWLSALDAGQTQLGATDPLSWHRHEMLFGFVGAAISGFALTAVPNWTGRLPIAGWPLAGLAAWWLAGRLLPFSPVDAPLAMLAAVDAGFYLGLSLLIMREIVQAKNRNIPIAGVIGLFGIADLLDFAGFAGRVEPALGAYCAIALAVVLVSLIGGRIVPSFTRNWMQKEGLAGSLPSQPNRFDIFVIFATAVALGAWIVGGSGATAGTALILAALLQMVRLLRWRGWRTFAAPIVLVLHFGYLWIPLGLLLLGLSGFDSNVPASAGIHALTVGALSGMIVAVMTRAILGHTGRSLHAGPATCVSYLAIHMAAVVRISASFLPVHYSQLLWAAGTLWVAGFGLFALAYAPVLLRSRVGE